ncbi:MAG: HAD-IIIA family hydrolase [Flavobacterium sp.]|nr:HAD-IIIA family hydrolase [Flavobacterium sp.]
MQKSYKELMNGITTFIFDLDGVLTNGLIHITSEGELLRTMYIRDGYAMKTAVDNGYKVCVISGGSNQGVKVRLNNLGVTDVYLDIPDKIAVYNQYVTSNGLSREQVLYMGDDLPDYHVMKRCGLAACPQDAAPEIKSISHYVSHKKGGEGAVRDVIEQVLKNDGKWMSNYNAQLD